MATTSFDKSVVIKESEAVDRLVDSLLNDELRKVSENLLSEMFLHHQYIKRELEKATKESQDPNTKWVSEEEFWHLN